MKAWRKILVPLLLAGGIGGGVAGAYAVTSGDGDGDESRAVDAVAPASRDLGCADLAAVANDATRPTIRSYETTLTPDTGAITVYGDDGSEYEFALSDTECIDDSNDVSGLVSGAIANYNQSLKTLCRSTLRELGYRGAIDTSAPVPVGRGQDDRIVAPLGDSASISSLAWEKLRDGSASLPSGALREPTVEWVKEACFGASES